MKIWANCIVNNEENFIWFALMSVVDHVDKILVWDTGSTDKTVEIIKEVIKEKEGKVEFKEVGSVDKYEFTKMRQAMLEESSCDWILILDGDEIWWEDSIEMIIRKIQMQGNRIDGIVMPVVVSVGDIYHFQEEKAGRYEILGRKGHFNLRVINRRIPGLHLAMAYPLEGYLDSNNKLVQENKKVIFLEAPYLHVTHLKRSGIKRKFDKFKYELGIQVPKDFKFPEVLYRDCPKIIPSPWSRMTGIQLLKAGLLTPLRKIKRRF